MNSLNLTSSSPESLFAQVEKAWEQGQGYERACQLAAEHSEYGEALFDLLDALIQTALAPSPDTVISEQSAAGLADRLDALGDSSLAGAVRESAGLIQPSTEPPTPANPRVERPPNKLASAREARVYRSPVLSACIHILAKERLGMNLKVFANALRVPMRFLREIDSHPKETPLGAIEELARRGTDLGLDHDEALATLLEEPEGSASLSRAASGQDGMRHSSAFSYPDLVEQSFRDAPDERDFWLAFTN